jgi:hypothetical protein
MNVHILHVHRTACMTAEVEQHGLRYKDDDSYSKNVYESKRAFISYIWQSRFGLFDNFQIMYFISFLISDSHGIIRVFVETVSAMS